MPHMYFNDHKSLMFTYIQNIVVTDSLLIGINTSRISDQLIGKRGFDRKRKEVVENLPDRSTYL
jgi:hypothetical protein